jgi:DNA repair ATPase RecN
VSNIVPINPYPGHPLRALKQFAEDADRIVERFDELKVLPGIVRTEAKALQDIKQFDELFAEAKQTATLSEHEVSELAWCETALQRFDPDSNYEDNMRETDLKRAVVADRIAVLLGAFPNANPGDPQVYVRNVIENVSSLALTLPALDAAIWEIVGTKKFVPAVSEVMEVVNSQCAKWDERFFAIWNLADKSRRTVAALDALQTEMREPIKARAAQMQLNSLTRAVEQARKALIDAQELFSEAGRDLEEKREAFGDAKLWLLECQDAVLKSERALADAIKRLDEFKGDDQ